MTKARKISRRITLFICNTWTIECR